MYKNVASPGISKTRVVILKAIIGYFIVYTSKISDTCDKLDNQFVCMTFPSKNHASAFYLKFMTLSKNDDELSCYFRKKTASY